MNALHQSVYVLYPNAVSVSGDTVSDLIAYDITGKKIVLDEAKINAQLPIEQNNDLIAQCKAQAMQLLAQTDWVEIPSVSNTANTHYLKNVADFIAYRVALRALAVNPVANPTFPTLPTEQWS